MAKALGDTLAKTVPDANDKRPFDTLNDMKVVALIDRLATH